VGLSPPAFSRLFRRKVGRTFKSYLLDLRLGAASRRLLETDLGISEIAYATGFASLSNFNHAFRLRRGLAPGDYRKKTSGSLGHAAPLATAGQQSQRI